MADADSFDYVIVGAGAAGSVLANRLTEDPGVTVCVLEAGPPDRNPWIHIPAGFIKTLVDPSCTWQFKTEPTANTGGRRIPTTQGRTLGGSSSINGMVYNRGQPDDLNNWAQRGNRGWGYADVLPYYRRSETAHRLRRRGARARGRHPRHRHGLDQPRVGGLHRRLRRPRDPAQRGLQQRRPGRRRLFPARHPARAPGERRARLPQAGLVAPQHRGPHQRARQRHPVRRQARGRRALPPRARRPGAGGAGGARGGAVQRHGEHGAAAPGLRRRSGGAARQARRAGGARAARRRRELPRPLRLPHRDARQARRADPEPARARRAAGRAGGALGHRASEHPGDRAFPRPRVLEILRGAGRAGPAMRVHARLLRRRQDLRARRLPRRHRRRVAAPAGEHWMGARPQHRRVGRPEDPAQLPLPSHGPARPPRRHAAGAADARDA